MKRLLSLHIPYCYLKPSELFLCTKEDVVTFSESDYPSVLSHVCFPIPGSVLQVPHGRRVTSSIVLGEEGPGTQVRSICQIY